ncbi:hypothetical protein Salat_1723000 [Sesamum alatum]|uniref:Uncharacterized protein n=1 Tax=Sesamum alatum TaxID=300844 RepID=A0AAE1Y7V3_9LAMI|nr:hypothetical protein Salat_1723000 [Sesamum alatum]
MVEIRTYILEFSSLCSYTIHRHLPDHRPLMFVDGHRPIAPPFIDDRRYLTHGQAAATSFTTTAAAHSRCRRSSVREQPLSPLLHLWLAAVVAATPFTITATAATPPFATDDPCPLLTMSSSKRGRAEGSSSKHPSSRSAAPVPPTFFRRPPQLWEVTLLSHPALPVKGWRCFFDCGLDAYTELSHEFYTTFAFSTPSDLTLDMPNVLKFRLLVYTFSMSLTDFNIALGFTTNEIPRMTDMLLLIISTRRTTHTLWPTLPDA